MRVEIRDWLKSEPYHDPDRGFLTEPGPDPLIQIRFHHLEQYWWSVRRWRETYELPWKYPTEATTSKLISDFCVAVANDEITELLDNWRKSRQSLDTRKIEYTADFLGDDAAENSPRVLATRNKLFFSYFKFFCAAWRRPDGLVAFTHEPDGFCGSVRGGEDGVGNHCLTPVSPSLSKDRMSQRAILDMLRNGLAEKSRKSIYLLKRSGNQEISEMRLPISMLFDRDVMRIFHHLFVMPQMLGRFISAQ